ncbi:MAG: cellulase family glycosylhydrolase, partial [Tangfeifania sp.]
VDESWLNRIEQVADWGLERDLFIVINSHHDDWIKDNYNEANKARFDSIWTQISERFKDKPEKLIFEVLNEPHGLTKAQNDDMHARIISIIRKTNPTRLIIFQGHNWGGSDELINASIPVDDYVIGSFHSYDPYFFGLEGQGTWGLSSDYAELDAKFRSVKNWSEENNIPVFLGEFGAINKADYNSRMKHYRAYMELSEKYGFAPVAWDDGGDFRILQREQHNWNEIKDILIYTSAKSPEPYINLKEDSIITVGWRNNVSNHDSIIIQRKLATQDHFSNLVTLKPDTNLYYDIKPVMNKYYDYRIIAHYNDTTGLYSEPFRIFFPAWTRPERIPFNDTLTVIPGVIEAEDFDKGGEGFTYHDADNRNIAGDYRPDEGVDIYDRLGEGFHIGNAVAGEWTEYSVDVKSEGWYNVTAEIAANFGGGTFQISVDTVHSEIMTARTSYSPLNTLPVSTQMYLYPGEQIMRFTVLTDEEPFNIDRFIFELATNRSQLKNVNSKFFRAYQNRNNELIIKQENYAKTDYFQLFTINGKLKKTIALPEPETRISTLQMTPGTYIIHTISGKSSFSQKIIIR